MKYMIINYWESRILAMGYETVEQAEAWVRERRIDPTSVVFVQYQSMTVGSREGI